MTHSYNVQLIQKFFFYIGVGPDLTGQCVKRPVQHELLRHSCTCIPDIPYVYHLLVGASLDPRGEQTGCSPHRDEWPQIHLHL